MANTAAIRFRVIRDNRYVADLTLHTTPSGNVEDVEINDVLVPLEIQERLCKAWEEALTWHYLSSEAVRILQPGGDGAVIVSQQDLDNFKVAKLVGMK